MLNRIGCYHGSRLLYFVIDNAQAMFFFLSLEGNKTNKTKKKKEITAWHVPEKLQSVYSSILRTPE